VLGNYRGRVEAVQMGRANGRLEAITLSGPMGMSEGDRVPAGAILSADGRVVRLAEHWIDTGLDGSSGNPIELVRGAPVRSADNKRQGKLRAVCFDRISGAVTALVVAGRGAAEERLLPIDRVKQAGPGGIVATVNAAEWSGLKVFASDGALRDAVLTRLEGDPELQALLRSITVDLHDQRVRLRGYVSTRAQADRAAEVVRSVPGVLQVDQELVSDTDLAEAVIQALRQDPQTAAARLDVQARFGQVDIVGIAPDSTVARRIDDVASHVPGVQGVHNMTGIR
jgi:osmotically-inducible protein OsmY